MKESVKLKESIKLFLQTVNKDNFSSSYQKLVDIILSYKAAGITKDVAKDALRQIDEDFEMDDYQEDVYLEICARVEGKSSDTKNIIW